MAKAQNSGLVSSPWSVVSSFGGWTTRGSSGFLFVVDAGDAYAFQSETRCLVSCAGRAIIAPTMTITKRVNEMDDAGVKEKSGQPHERELKPAVMKTFIFLSMMAVAYCLPVSSRAAGANDILNRPGVSPVAEKILRRMSAYYETLHSFRGVVTSIDVYSSSKIVHEERFAFMRPNRFVILPDNTNDPRLYCDGTNVFYYEPFSYNCYAQTPAPAQFDDFSNWIGPDLVRMMASKYWFDFFTKTSGVGLISLQNRGKENVNGIPCDHLYFQETNSTVMELWVARGKRPRLVKYASHFPNPLFNLQNLSLEERVSYWEENRAISPGEFAFLPPTGAVERPWDANYPEVSETVSNGVRTQTLHFVSNEQAEADSRKMANFINRNQARFQAIALTNLLATFPDLSRTNLTFVGVQPSAAVGSPSGFVITFALSNTIATTVTSHSVETAEKTVSVTISPEGIFEGASRGNSVSIRSK